MILKEEMRIKGLLEAKPPAEPRDGVPGGKWGKRGSEPTRPASSFAHLIASHIGSNFVCVFKLYAFCRQVSSGSWNRHCRPVLSYLFGDRLSRVRQTCPGVFFCTTVAGWDLIAKTTATENPRLRAKKIQTGDPAQFRVILHKIPWNTFRGNFFVEIPSNSRGGFFTDTWPTWAKTWNLSWPLCNSVAGNRGFSNRCGSESRKLTLAQLAHLWHTYRTRSDHRRRYF